MLMKSIIFTLLFSAISISFTAQIGLDITAKGQFNSTWLFNQNISEDGAEQDYAPGWGSHYGLGLGMRLGFFGIGMETNFGKHNAEYSGVYANQDYASTVALSTFQLPLFLRFQNKGGVYFEMGAQYNRIRKALYTRENLLPLSSDVSGDYAKSYSTALIGFGINRKILKSVPLGFVFGFRLQYGIKDARGVDAYGLPLDNSLIYPNYAKTRAASAGINIGLMYTIDTKEKESGY